MRRGRFEQKSNKRRRVLDMDQEGWQCKLFFFFAKYSYAFTHAHTVDDEQGTDIRDLEFSMANDIGRLVHRAASLNDRDIQIIKLIICSALYPQLAMGDEHNPYRPSNEIVFNTPGTVYHLLSVATYCYSLNLFSQELFVHSSYQCHCCSSELGAGHREERSER